MKVRLCPGFSHPLGTWSQTWCHTPVMEAEAGGLTSLSCIPSPLSFRALLFCKIVHAGLELVVFLP